MLHKCVKYINPPPAVLSYFILTHYRDPQLQVGENYWYLFHLKPNIYKCPFSITVI